MKCAATTMMILFGTMCCLGHEVVGLWTFSGLPGETVAGDTEFENKAGGDLSLILKKQQSGALWARAKSPTYLADVPATCLFSDTALTNLLGSLSSSLRMEGGSSSADKTPWMVGTSLVMTNFAAIVGSGSWTVEIIARMSKASEGYTVQDYNNDCALFGVGSASSGNTLPSICYRPWRPNASGQLHGFTNGSSSEFTCNFYNRYPYRISAVSPSAGDWRHILIAYNADSKTFVFRSDYSDFDTTTDQYSGFASDFGPLSEFRIGGVWSNGHCDYPCGIVDVAAVRVSRGMVAWHDGMTPWISSNPRELVHYRFSGELGKTVSVVTNDVASDLAFTFCTSRYFDSNVWNIINPGSMIYTNDTQLPYLSVGSGRDRVINDSSVASCTNGAWGRLALNMQNLPAYFADSFTVEMIVRVETQNYSQQYPNPSVSLFSAPAYQSGASGFYMQSRQCSLIVGAADGSTDVGLLRTNYGVYDFARSVWHHVAVVCDRSLGIVKFYLDGICASSFEGGKDGSFDPSLPIWKPGNAMQYATIGGVASGWTSDRSGVVDEFRITRGVLDPIDFLRPKRTCGGGAMLMLR